MTTWDRFMVLLALLWILFSGLLGGFWELFANGEDGIAIALAVFLLPPGFIWAVGKGIGWVILGGSRSDTTPGPRY